MAKKGIVIGGSTLAVGGLAAWVAIRLYTRQRVLEELELEGLSQAFSIARQGSLMVSGLGLNLDLNLPPPVELAKSMVPLFGFNSPYAALDDIAIHGRASKYWPKDYREPSALAALGLETLAFQQLAQS